MFTHLIFVVGALSAFNPTRPEAVAKAVPQIEQSIGDISGYYICKGLETGVYGETQVVTRQTLDPKRVIEADQVLVGRNATRRAYNTRMRERRGFAGEMPATGDKLVCLRNNKRKGLYNGALWSVKNDTSRAASALRLPLRT